MTPARKRLIRHQLLNIYKQASPYLLLEDTAYSALTLIVKPAPTRAEFDEVTKLLETDRVVVRLFVAEEYKTKITDEGQAELLS